MENILSQFKTNNLDIKLTDDKLFINTKTSNEAFALRSINGIGVIDHVEDYNEKLSEWKKGKENLKIAYIVFAIGLVVLVFSIIDFSFPFLAIILLALGLYLYNKANKGSKPTLMSAVRIMMSGGNRDFLFDKTGIESGTIAEFVAQVESTLTSYHKNHN